jgi:SAM-dependent methyltransferase
MRQATAQTAGVVLADILTSLACPRCHGSLTGGATALECRQCTAVYALQDGIPDFRVGSSQLAADDWTDHWTDARQQTAVQRFFSWYRKAVFSRTVRYYCHRYFPPQGIFLEAGSGTSETSMRLDRLGGKRVFVALDIVPSVLKRCHPVMDVRLAGDIFQLPFSSNSLDGLWNVGVMEHFTHADIDRILGEFRRVLKPEAPLILFWPGRDSIPQKILSGIQSLIHLLGRRQFRFHPPEISQLRSLKEGRRILERNGFHPLDLAFGLRSLFAFKVLVGSRVRD